MLLGNFSVITGGMACGKTLTAIAFLKELSKININKSIISNTKIKGIKYLPFKLTQLFDYKNSIVYLTHNEYTTKRPNEYITDNMIGFINDLKDNNNLLILELLSVDELLPVIVPYYDLIVRPRLLSDERLHIQILNKGLDEDWDIRYFIINNALEYTAYMPQLWEMLYRVELESKQ